MSLRVPKLPGLNKKGALERFAPGEQISGRYDVVEEIGRGGAGVVVRARDTRLRRDVALKAVLTGETEAHSSHLRKTLEHEAVALARLDHPNIVRIHDLDVYKQIPYLVMTLVEGESIAAVLARRRALPLDVVLNIVREAASALDYAHDLGVLHRDVKPANILYGRGYRISLVDFGLVSLVGRLGATTTVSGTPAYIAPEVAAAVATPPELQHSCDVYSLAATAYEMITGAAPFGTGGESLLRRIIDEPAPLIRSRRGDLPEQFDAVFARALAKRPDERPLSAGAFAAELFDAARKDESQRSILIVDDDADIRTIFKLSFELAYPDALVMCAEDGLVAFQLAQARRPDLITVDLDMPRFNGAELCLALRNADSTRDIPILVVSRSVDDDSRDVLVDYQIEYVNKPIDPRELVKITNRLLDPNAARRST